MSIRDLWDLLAPVAPERVRNWGEAISDEVDDLAGDGGSPDRVRIDAEHIFHAQGTETTTKGSITGWPCWFSPGAANQALGGILPVLPADWNTFDAYLIWTIAPSSGTTQAEYRGGVESVVTDGGTLPDIGASFPSANSTGVLTAPAEKVLKETVIVADVSNAAGTSFFVGAQMRAGNTNGQVAYVFFEARKKS